MMASNRKLSFFIIISSSSKYAEYLGGSATFSGIIIGIPTLFSGMALIPMTRYDRGRSIRLFSHSRNSMLMMCRTIHYSIAHRMLRGHSGTRRICDRIPRQFPVLDPHRTMFERHLIFGFHVLQTILHGSFDCRGSPSNDAFQLVGDWTSSGNDPWSVSGWFIVQGRIPKRDLQRIHQSWLGYGRLLRDLLVDCSQIFRSCTHDGNELGASRNNATRLWRRRREPNRGPGFFQDSPLPISARRVVHRPITPYHTPTVGCHYLHVLVLYALLLCPRVLGGQPPRFWRCDFYPQLVPLCSREFHSTWRNHCIPIFPCKHAVRTSHSRSTSTCFRDWPGSVWAFGLHFTSRHQQSRVWLAIRVLVAHRSRFQSRHYCDAQSPKQAAPSRVE